MERGEGPLDSRGDFGHSGAAMMVAVTFFGLALGLVSVSLGVGKGVSPIWFAAGIITFLTVLVLAGFLDLSPKTSDRIGWGYLLLLCLGSGVFGVLRIWMAGDVEIAAGFQLAYALIFGAVAVSQLKNSPSRTHP